MPRDLQSHLRQMIAVDTRPRTMIDRFQAGAGRKRTTIRNADVIPLTGALPVKQMMLDKLANAGITIRGVLKQGPLLRSAIKQGTLADCFELSTMTGLALSYPTWLDDYIILPVNLADGTPGVVVNFYESKSNSIVQITTSLEISTSYNNPGDDDIRPELIEKTYGFFRSGVADYYKNNWGNGFEVGIAFGFKVTASRYPSTPGLASAFINTHRTARRIVMILTAAVAKVLIASHAYSGKDGSTAINPWDGPTDVPVTDAILGSASEVAAIYALEPANILPRLPTQIIPAPNPMPPAVPVSPSVTPTPEPVMPDPSPTGTLRLLRDTANAFDGITYEWTCANGTPTILNGDGKDIPAGATSGSGFVAMPPHDLTITLIVAGANPATDHFQVSKVCKLITAPTPPVSPTPTPTTAPIATWDEYADGTMKKRKA